jgi:pilus assembly protein CpaB
MSSNLIRIIAVFFVLLAVILAIIGFRMSQRYAETARLAAEKAKNAQSTAHQVQVVVSVKPLEANQPIPEDAVKLAPVDVPPENHFDKVEDVVGHWPIEDVDAGLPVTRRMLREANPLAELVPPGYEAVSLNLSDLIGVGGMLRTHDVVDVLVFLRGEHGNDQSQARVLLRDALVLAVDGRITSSSTAALLNAANPLGQQQVHHDRTVVLAVPAQLVSRLVLGTSLGEVRLALHGKASQATAAQFGAESLPASDAEGLAYDSAVTSAAWSLNKAPPDPGPGIVIYRGSAASTVHP